MKLKQSIISAIVVGGSLGLATGPVLANPESFSRAEASTDRYPTQGTDDQSLAPGVPGVTEENNSDMSAKQVRMVQEALQEEGYAPGRSDGAMDNDTRAAIREFQSDNNITVTGTVDSRTAQLLGIGYDRSSG